MPLHPRPPHEHLSAEEMLDLFRLGLRQKVELAQNVLLPLYQRASEKQQILMMGPLDEAAEAERLLGALAVAGDFLATHPEPQRDRTPPRKHP